MAGAKRSCDQWEGAVIDLNVSPMVVLNIHHLQNRLSFFFSQIPVSGSASTDSFFGNKLNLQKAAYLAQCLQVQGCPFVMSQSAAALLIPSPAVKGCRTGEQQEIILPCSAEGLVRAAAV